MSIAISTIIPCYNSSQTIGRCVESVLNQTYPITEIIIIDDGSKDNSLEILNQIRNNNRTDTKIIIMSQTNSGPSAARNNGVSVSSGYWIAFLDSDDMWFPDKIDKQVKAIESTENIAFVCSFASNQTQKVNDLYKEISFLSMLFRNKVVTSSVLVRKDVFKNFQFDETMKYSEDYKLWLQLTAKYKSHVVQSQLVYYSADTEGSLSKNMWAMEKNELANFVFLYKKGFISILLFICVYVFSFLKYSKRVFLIK